MTGSETGRPEEVCGESYAHGWELIDASDGYVTYECWICGAEVVLEPHPEAVHGS